MIHSQRAPTPGGKARVTLVEGLPQVKILELSLPLPAPIRRALERNPILVTALNPVIGYELGAAVAKKAYAEGRAVKDVAKEMTDLTDDELDRLLDPAALTEGGIKH